MRRQHAASVALQRESAFEEKLLQFMQDAFPKRTKKRKSRDPDKLFLLSLYEEMKRVPEDIRLDAKSELIQVLKKYQRKPPIKTEKGHHVHVQAPGNTNKSVCPVSAGGIVGGAGGSTTTDKITLPQHGQISHSMYQLQKKYEKNEKEASPQSQVDRVQQQHNREQAVPGSVSLHAPQQIPHAIFQLQKKYEESTVEKVHQQQTDQRKHVEASTHQQHPAAHQQPPPPAPPNANDPSQQQHLHHPQMSHGIMFPLPQIRNEQSGGPQHHTHNPHQQQQQQQQSQQAAQQHSHQQSQQQHLPPPIFGNTSTAATVMNTDRPAMAYENVG